MRATSDFIGIYMLRGVLVVIAANPVILKPLVNLKHLMTSWSFEDLTKLLPCTLQEVPESVSIFVLSTTIWIYPPSGIIGTVTSTL